MAARDYQLKGFNDIKTQFLAGYMRVLLWLATGGGKTFIFCMMIKSAFEKNKKIIVVVRGRKLVDQASERLVRENVPHGVYMANHWNYRPNLPVQICSIDTLIARKVKPPADLIIIDEAHMATSPGYKRFLESPEYKNSRVVAVTATPYPEKGSLTHIAQTYVQPIRMIELVEQGYLVPFRYFSGEAIELQDIEIKSDYVCDQLEEAMVECQLDGKIVANWKKRAKGRPTLAFVPTIRYSKQLVEKFKKEGISAEHCDAFTPDEERNAILARSKSGETQIIINVGVWGTGVDLPWISCIILGRSTKSYNLFIQQCGRGTRPDYAPGMPLDTIEQRLLAIKMSVKKDCILLDHAKNIKEHEYPTDEPEIDLDGKTRARIVRKSKTCQNPKCRAIYRGKVCHECGHEYIPLPKTEAEILESEKELIELKNIELDPIKRAFKNYKIEQRNEGKRANWACHRLVDRFGLEKARPYLTKAFLERYENNNKLFKNSPFNSFK